MSNLAAILLLLSGFSALTYQVVWVRLLGLSIGMTSAAVGAVLAAVFLGMALGSWLSGRLPPRWQGQFRTFAVVEAVVGICALLLLPVLLNLDHLMAMMPEFGSQLWFRFSIATLLLAIPAAGLGAAYPLVANIFTRERPEYGSNLGLLYAMHTAGAVGGALLAAFALIPWWGLDGALYTAVAVNLLVALFAIILAKRQSVPIEDEKESLSKGEGRSWMGLIVLSVTGMTAVAVEIGWTKYLTIYAESTFVGFSLLLAMFLSGIAIGSIAVSPLLKRIKSPQVWMAFGLVMLGAAMLITRSAFSLVPQIDSYIKGLDFIQNTEIVVRYGAVLLIMLPTSLIFGALFPLSLYCYSGENKTQGRRVGQGYAVNTLAGLVGAGLAGIWLIPTYGTDRLLLASSLLVTLSALLLYSGLHRGRQQLLLGIAVVGIVFISQSLPRLDFRDLIVHMDNKARIQNKDPHFLFYKEGHAGVITLSTYDDGIIKLKNNSLIEAHRPIENARGALFLGLLAHLFKPDAESAFIVGYGGGIATELFAATDLQSIRVVELEPAVIDAMASLSGGEIPVLRDPRVTVDFNDARNTLLLDNSRYDIIVSQPSHPWRSGAGSMFTKEFFQIAQSRIKDNGVFVQWLNLYKMDATTLRAMFRSFFEAFPRGAVFADRKTPPQLFFLGSNQPLVLEHERVSDLLQRVGMKKFSKALGIQDPEELLRYYLMTRDEALRVAGEVPPNTDLNLLTETRLPSIKKWPQGEENPTFILNPYKKNKW